MKILVVEDEYKIGQYLVSGLKEENYTVDLATDGDTGYGMGSSEPYDLIILDLMLPGMDGLEVCKKLRQEKNTTPILMLTAKSQINDKVTGLDIGADDYLTKPFAFEELLSRIKAVTRRPPIIDDAVLRAGDLTLNRQSLVVKRKNREISLTNKEHKLLEYLLINKNRVVSKEQILKHIWDFESEVTANTVEANIKNLRRKLGDTKQSSIIKTVRGFGYKLTDTNV